MTFLKRENYLWGENPKKDLETYQKCGLGQIEPLFNSLEEVDILEVMMPTYSLTSSSLYVNSVLHVHSDIRQAETLPGHFYTDPDVFETLKERIFLKSWQ